MPQLIKEGQIVNNEWQIVEATETPDSVTLPSGKTIVPLNVWEAQKSQLTARQGEIGVWLNSDEFAEVLADDAENLPLIAINFPGFMDGRGFSTAFLLRQRYGFSGELRAIGHVIRDQLFYLSRCGFNAIQLDESIDLEAAVESLSDFGESYQASADQPLPLFRRKTA